ncbi:MAG: YciK family oxidoreductase [Gammaproteobacteria bacterium]|jgi:NAD(P)-dependent dehydrogenase (short-subunit alcohol dehydrogenase family)|nr:YciK family oxidoreductase [Gammaproteobacteria bacterium]MBT3489618.1 YciK family oxidoreductase [Gammaproteobacteria bacterium]MBT3719102.1 YciK family oxidoreductase [Gammaproteobacteria bacterium]MBT3843945.1 YciK family oxidoreductase [Gammaproteobacteria bacterium]MBT3893431.1 YciK family oxidoreductase [Gammaproteobacteria bacterium]
MDKNYTPHPELLQGRTILVTGAGSGLGRAAAVRYAEHGATVLLVGRTQFRLEDTYDLIAKAGHAQPYIFPLDFAKADEEAYQGLAGGIAQEIGHLDGLLHNAAHLGDLSPIEHYTLKQWETVFTVNVTAQFLLSKYCIPLLRQSEDGSIIFTSSGVGKSGHAYWGAYSASKFANEGMSQILADELEADGIRVNTIDPGVARTVMRAKAFPGENPNNNPTPESLMGAYLYLMGPDSREVSGRRFNAWVS